MTTYAELPNLSVEVEGGLRFAYHDTGGDGRPVVLLQHFRGNLDNWDPALIDDLAANGRVITFDYEGVAGSNGSVAHTIVVDGRRNFEVSRRNEPRSGRCAWSFYPKHRRTRGCSCLVLLDGTWQPAQESRTARRAYPHRCRDDDSAGGRHSCRRRRGDGRDARSERQGNCWSSRVLATIPEVNLVASLERL